MVSAKWKECDPATREKLQKEFAKETVNFHLEKDALLNSLTEEQRKKLAKIKADKRIKKYNEKLKKEMSENHKPKKPVSAYLLFVADNYNSIPESTFAVRKPFTDTLN